MTIIIQSILKLINLFAVSTIGWHHQGMKKLELML